MNKLKQFLGILWMLVGPVAFVLLIISAVKNINSSNQGDISNPIPWIIIISVFAPIAIGLTIFGWYSWKGEYDKDVFG
jgi:ABC-type polysaccharide/polyol phosphate export permease